MSNFDTTLRVNQKWYQTDRQKYGVTTGGEKR